MLVLKKVPVDEDLELAALGILRLQKIYRLKTSDLSTGQLHNKQISKVSSMSASDCFEIGKASYLNANYYQTVSWMWKSLELFYEERKTQGPTVKKDDILQYLAFSMWKEGDTPLALQLTNELLEILPNDEQALANKFHFELELRDLEEMKRGITSWDGQQFISQIIVASFSIFTLLNLKMF